jgi:hypothetical protein
MLFETKNGSISILYGRQSHDPLDTHTHTHAYINNAEPFQMGSNFAVPELILETFVINFLSYLKPWSKRVLGKDGVQKPSCFSDFPTFLPFVQHSLFRDWE